MLRREFLKLGFASGGLLLARGRSQLVFASDFKNAQKLVVVFLYGGADPLTLFPPLEDEWHVKHRPTLAVRKEDTLLTESPFGMNSALGPLMGAWKSGEMGVVHQFGLATVQRSHPLAQYLIEKGIDSNREIPADGFLSRAVVERFGDKVDPLRAVAIQDIFPAILKGSAKAMAFSSVDDLVSASKPPHTLRDSMALYRKSGDSSLQEQGKMIEYCIDKMRAAFPAGSARPPKGASGIQNQLKEISKVIGANVGLSVAFTSMGGWDSHANQRNMLTPNMSALAKGLSEFREELQRLKQWDSTTVVVVTEFGRAVIENGALGTDHGHASAAMVFGGSLPKTLRSQFVHQWKSLKPENLSEGRELLVRHDYRNVFGEIFQSRFGVSESAIKKVFPNHEYKPLGIFRS